MKKIFQLFFVVLIGLIFTSNIFAQTAASATWALNTTSASTPSVSGSVTATAESVTGLEFNSTSTIGSDVGGRLRGAGNTWPTSQTDIISTKYIEFTVSPATGNNFTVSSIAIKLWAASSSNLRASIYYSTDGFATAGTKIRDGNTEGSLPQASPVVSFSHSPSSLTILNGQTLTIRVYPWLHNQTSSLTGKYFVMSNLVVSGATVVPTTYLLSTTTVGNGTVSLTPAGGSYVGGTSVTMTAASDPGWFFQGYTGDVTSADSSKAVTVNSNLSVTATFRRNVTLTTNVDGSGSVTKTPSAATYLNGSNVTLTATSAAGWDFKQWTGDFSGTDSSDVMTLGNTNQTVTAVFRKFYNVTVTHEGPIYADNLTPAPAANGKYELNSTINLNPSLHPSWQVSKIIINGKDTSATSLTNYKVQKHTTIKYVVTPKYSQYTLLVTTLGKGSVEITPDPYNGTYDDGTIIFLKATPADGQMFTGWSGKLNSYESEQRIVMNENKIIFANFEEIKNTDVPASATWPLTADGSVVIKGDIDAPVENLVGTEINQYSGFEGAQRIRMAGTGNTWAANLTDQIENVYVEFSTTPKAGKTFTVRTVSVDLGASSTNTMRARVWYSTKDDFSSPVEIPFSTGKDGNFLIKDGATTVKASVEIPLKEGETFYLRVYPWHQADATASGKYMTIKDAIISNTITGAGSGEAEVPTVDAVELKSVTAHTAICKSAILNDGGGDITARGLCWSTKANPTIADNYTEEGKDLGEFSSYIGGLASGTTYYVRAYATNKAGTGYSAQLTIKTNTLLFKVYANVVGSGKVTTDPANDNLLFEQNSTVKFTAVPDNGWKFVGWSGGATGTSSTVSVKIDTVKNITAKFEIAVGVETEDGLPSRFALYQNYPNPFNPTTRISYALPERANVKISVFDMLAREVAVLVNGYKEAGRYEVTFDGANLSSGTYFYKLEAGNFIEVKKFILVK